MDEVELIFEKLFDYYKVASAAELSDKIGTSQKTISNWKVRNAISAIKKKCRELGIYNEIFGDLNSNIQSFVTNSGNASQNGNVVNYNNDLNEIDEALIGIFKRAYNKCLNDDKSINEDKLDELILYLTKFK